MPRKKINISEKLEYLSILDEKGKLDEKLEPKIPQDLLLKLYQNKSFGWQRLLLCLQSDEN